MNAFPLILLSICGIIFYGNCLPYREFWSKYKSRDDYYEDYYLKKVPKMRTSPEKVKEFLINHLSWFPLDDSQNSSQHKENPTQKSQVKRHETMGLPEKEKNYICKNYTVVYRVRQGKMKQKIAEKLKKFARDHNMQTNWTSLKNKSSSSMHKIKYFIKHQHFKEKFKNATHPLRYKGTKTKSKKKSKTINQTRKYGYKSGCPTRTPLKSSHAKPVMTSTTYLPPVTVVQEMTIIPTKVSQLPKEKELLKKPQTSQSNANKKPNVPECKEKHFPTPTIPTCLTSKTKHSGSVKGVKKPTKSTTPVDSTLPLNLLEPQATEPYEPIRSTSPEPFQLPECFELFQHTHPAQPIQMTPALPKEPQNLPEFPDNVPKSTNFPVPSIELPKYIIAIKNSQTPAIVLRPFEQTALSLQFKKLSTSEIEPQHSSHQTKFSQLPVVLQGPPMYIKTSLSNSKDSIKFPNAFLLPDVSRARFASPEKIKILIDLKTPSKTKNLKTGRNINRDFHLASIEGDNTNSTHVLETAGEMASDLAGRVTNLWHCVLGSHHIPDTRDVKFFLYTRRNVIQPELLNVNYDLINKKVQGKPFRVDIDCYDLKPDKIADFERISDENREIVKSNHLNIRAPTKILIHGYTGSYKDSRMAKIKDAYLNSGRYNVIQVDWEVLAAPPCYIRVTHHSKFVGETIAQFLNGLYLVGLNMSLVHLIGFSLGAQVAGFTGNNATIVPICRITGLDPALPLFLHTRPSGHLDRLDAKFVDVIHTCGGILAMLDPLGHVDFYPNGGTRQPGCEFSNLKCSHSRAPQYFAESVNSRKKFTGQLCLTWEEYVSGQCDNTSDTSFMGEPCSRRSASGKYYLLTKSKEPFVL